MRMTVLCLLAMLALAAPATAQTTLTAGKISGKVHCAKADPNYTVPVGDKPGHALTMQKSTCTWTGGPVAHLTPKSGEDESTGEMSGASGRVTGYHIVTMDNGDKYTVQYTGSVTVTKDNSAMLHGNWTIVGGTGTLVGIKGRGTYTGAGGADGSGDVTVVGDYTVVPAKAVGAVKKKT